MKRSKKIFLGILLLGLFFITAGISYFFFLYSKIYVKPSAKTPLVTTTPTPTPDPMAPKNILILGYGGAGHDGGSLTDTIIVAHVIPKEKYVILISIPRDIWIPISMKNGPEYFKLNHAFAVALDTKRFPNKLPQYEGISGAGLLAKESVSLVTGLPIDYFVSLNFDGFRNIVNILNGVNVNVPYSFKDEYYPIKGLEEETCGKTDEEMKLLHATLSGQLLESEFKCRFETLEFKKGLLEMDAETALKFVRSRHSDINGGDFGRSIRQQAFITGVKNKLLSFGSITKIIPVINSLAKNVQTDIDVKTAISLMVENYDFSDISIKSISLDTDNVLIDKISEDNQYILVPKEGDENWESIKKYLNSEIEKVMVNN
jgi:LCP family protein required for cell wall assembly